MKSVAPRALAPLVLLALAVTGCKIVSVDRGGRATRGSTSASAPSSSRTAVTVAPCTSSSRPTPPSGPTSSASSAPSTTRTRTAAAATPCCTRSRSSPRSCPSPPWAPGASPSSPWASQPSLSAASTPEGRGTGEPRVDLGGASHPKFLRTLDWGFMSLEDIARGEVARFRDTNERRESRDVSIGPQPLWCSGREAHLVRPDGFGGVARGDASGGYGYANARRTGGCLRRDGRGQLLRRWEFRNLGGRFGRRPRPALSERRHDGVGWMQRGDEHRPLHRLHRRHEDLRLHRRCRRTCRTTGIGVPIAPAPVTAQTAAHPGRAAPPHTCRWTSPGRLLRGTLRSRVATPRRRIVG